MVRDVRSAYFQIWYLENKAGFYRTLDSLYTGMASATAVRVQTGDGQILDQHAADAKANETRMIRQQLNHDLAIEQEALMLAMNVNEVILPEEKPLARLSMDENPGAGMHPLLEQQQAMVRLAETNIRVQKKGLLPEYSGRTFTQRLYGVDPPFSGFSFSVGVPLASKSQRKRIEAARIDLQLQGVALQAETRKLTTALAQAQEHVERCEQALVFYEVHGLTQATKIQDVARRTYEAGDISFADWMQFVTQAVMLQQNHLDALNDYNQAVIRYQYLLQSN